MKKRLLTSVVGEFNHTQTDAGKLSISDFSVHPYKLDYCDTWRETDNFKSKATEWKCNPWLEKEKGDLVYSVRDRKESAREALQQYKSMKDHCSEQWKEIVQLEDKNHSRRG